MTTRVTPWQRRWSPSSRIELVVAATVQTRGTCLPLILTGNHSS